MTSAPCQLSGRVVGLIDRAEHELRQAGIDVALDEIDELGGADGDDAREVALTPTRPQGGGGVGRYGVASVGDTDAEVLGVDRPPGGFRVAQHALTPGRRLA